MKNLILLSFIAMTIATITSCKKQDSANPFLTDYTTVYNIPPFDQIKPEHYIPAFEEGIKQHDADIQAIIDNKEAPTFENVIAAYDKSGVILNKVMLVFSALNETDSNDELKEIGEKIIPELTAHGDRIGMNADLFAKVKAVYDNREKAGLTKEQTRLLEKIYKGFVRSGALLNDADKAKLADVNKQISSLCLQFGTNLLNETNDFVLVIDKKEDLAGLPQSTIAAAADEAKSRNMEGKWAFTLQAPSRIPFLQYSANRALREKVYTAYIKRGDNDNKSDNKQIINKLVNLRLQKANLLGFKTYADYALDDVMAKTIDNAEGLLMSIWTPAIARANEEIADMQKMIEAEGDTFKLAAWDYAYYAEKVRKAKFDLNEDEIKPYFALDNVVNAAFTCAQKLYGITFTELKDAPKYNPEVRVYDVKDAEGKHLAVFMTDYFPRASKRQGAWMSMFQEANSTTRPIVYNVGNFTKPTGDTPSLLTIDEVETLFHEFGHALQGMLTKANYTGISGTNVDRDFVELPSQINEHWSMEPEVLKMYAKHYKTGEVIPDSLLAKIDAASKFNQGFTTTELVGAALLDLAWHKIDKAGDYKVRDFESQLAAKLNMPKEITYRYRSTYFKHIFDNDQYSAGYYTYLWAEVLDADGFELFKEKGIFDPATAKAYRENILEPGDGEDPMVLYKNFRGQAPNADYLLIGRGLK